MLVRLPPVMLPLMLLVPPAETLLPRMLSTLRLVVTVTVPAPLIPPLTFSAPVVVEVVPLPVRPPLRVAVPPKLKRALFVTRPVRVWLAALKLRVPLLTVVAPL